MNINDFILDELKKCNYDVPTVRLSYQRVLEEFGIHSTQKSFERQIQRVKKAYLESNPDKLQDSQYVLDNEISSFTPDIKNSDKVTIEEKGNESTVTVNVYNDIKNIDELLTECKVDLEKWIVNSHIVNRWDSSLGGEKVAMYQVKASLSKRIPDQQQIPVLGQVVVNPNNSGQYCLFHTSEGDKVIKKTLIIADAQIGYERNIETGKLKPFHDRKSMDVILKILSKNFFDEIVIDGDMLDFPEASTFAQKPEFAMTMQPALNELGWYLIELRKLAPNSKIVYLEGNHEKRNSKRIIENLSFAYNLKVVGQDFSIFSLRNLLNLDKINVELIEDYPAGKYWVTDDLVIKHGNFTNLNKELSVTMVSVIMGHLHRPETVSKTIHDRHGKKTVTVSCVPALCANTGIVPGSEAGPIWSTGFTYVETNLRNNQSNVHHVITHDGECIFKGNIYSGNDYQFP
jgi:metallophosphoesterase superfamily enzyme